MVFSKACTKAETMRGQGSNVLNRRHILSGSSIAYQKTQASAVGVCSTTFANARTGEADVMLKWCDFNVIRQCGFFLLPRLDFRHDR
jgi:hypothetical protein